MSEVVIAGAGAAGSTLAIALGRAGVRVTLLEQHVFPREKACAEGIMPAGVGVLSRLGLADRIGGARLWGVRYDGHGLSAETRFPPAPGGLPGHGLAQRRLRLDALLWRIACETPHVTAHEGIRVEGPLAEGGRVRGVLAGGRIFRAQLVVAADGSRSLLRRKLGLEGPAAGNPRLGVRVHLRLAGREADPFVQVFLGAEHELYLTPLPDGHVTVAALASRDALPDDARAFFRAAVREHAALAELLAGAEPVSVLAGRTPLAGSARRGFVPGCVLLGDAARSLDPITGSGIAQALLSAELLAACLRERRGEGRGLSGAAADLAVARFDRQRRILYRDAARVARMALTLAGHPRLAAGALHVFRHQPAVLRHLVGVAAGTRALLPLGRAAGLPIAGLPPISTQTSAPGATLVDDVPTPLAPGPAGGRPRAVSARVP